MNNFNYSIPQKYIYEIDIVHSFVLTQLPILGTSGRTKDRWNFQDFYVLKIVMYHFVIVKLFKTEECWDVLTIKRC